MCPRTNSKTATELNDSAVGRRQESRLLQDLDCTSFAIVIPITIKVF